MKMYLRDYFIVIGIGFSVELSVFKYLIQKIL